MFTQDAFTQEPAQNTASPVVNFLGATTSSNPTSSTDSINSKKLKQIDRADFFIDVQILEALPKQPTPQRRSTRARSASSKVSS